MFSKRRFVFLTFSDINLKVISVDFNSKKPKIIFSDQKELPPGMVFDDEIIDLIRFKEEVRKLLFANAGNLRSKKVVLAINEQEVFFNRFTLKDNPEKLKDEISKFLQTKLPYELKTTTIHFKKITRDTYQLLSTKHQLIKDLASIFNNTNFELSKIELLPYACLSLLAKEIEPYIFILSEDQTLQFGLVSNKILIFSASLKLTKALKDSKEQVLKNIKKLILEYEANELSNISLQNIFIIGSGAQTLNDFLAAEELSPHVINLLEKFSGEISSDAADYTKALLLASAINSSLPFSAREAVGISEKSEETGMKLTLFNFKKPAILLVVFIFVILFGFFLINLTKKTPNTSKIVDKPVISTTSALKKATASAEKPAEVQIPPPEVLIDKAGVKIDVLNGTSTKGLANQTKDLLTSKGFNVVSVGNAVNNNYPQTVIQFKPSKEAILADLTTALSERYSVIRGDHLSENDQFDIIIIIGRT